MSANEFTLIKESIGNTLSSSRQNIQIFIHGLTFKRGLDSIKDLIENAPEDEAENKEPDNNQNVKDKKRKFVTFKYTSNKHIYEAILVNSKPYFMTIIDGQLELVDQIEQGTRILRPPHEEEYIYKPLAFESEEEIWRLIDICRTLTIDSLFSKINEFVSMFLIHHKYVIDYISALITFSYFQDRYPTVPYTMFVSDNGSGKSTIGDIIEMLGYRCVNLTDPTTANVYRIFGKIETGQCILVLDEVDKIDQSDMMSVLKSGYERNKTVTRTNNQSNSQDHYYAYGLKIMLGERTPDPSKARGVLDRTFIISNFKGKPNLDIKEIKNAESGHNIRVKEQLEFLRKSLMIYRLIHFNAEITDIETGLEGRDKELSKPILQVFFDSQALPKVEKSFEVLINEKHDRKANSLERDALEVIVDLFVDFQDGVIPFSAIWSSLIEKTNGHINEYKSHQLETESHGTIYKTPFSKMLRDKFGAKDPENRNSAVRLLFFDIDKTKRHLESYTKDNGSIKIKCSPIINDSGDSNTESLFESFWETSTLNKENLNPDLNTTITNEDENNMKILAPSGMDTRNSDLYIPVIGGTSDINRAPSCNSSNGMKDLEHSDTNNAGNFQKSENENMERLEEHDHGEIELDFQSLRNTFWREFIKIEGKEEFDKFTGFKVIGYGKLKKALIGVPKENNESQMMTVELLNKLIKTLLKEGTLAELTEGRYYRTNSDDDEISSSAATAAA
ncbi:hypothetical protein [Candidatus Nitrosocosmicus hydrocola]|uniref:hypothetical protein n=1 Tax=Candidatus Nitrosocosmicus hydrocola TaxID=1826872 RepID=UPI00137258EB|nr:hypothetical protein [Candidatus Nitrosocosmicus hydrocola]